MVHTESFFEENTVPIEIFRAGGQTTQGPEAPGAVRGEQPPALESLSNSGVYLAAAGLWHPLHTMGALAVGFWFLTLR